MKPSGFRLEASGTLWQKKYSSMKTALNALNKLESKGYRGAVNNLGGKWVVRLRVDSFLDNPSVPKNKFIKCKAVKFNRNGSVSIKK